MKYTKKQRQAIADVFKKVHNKMRRNPPWDGFKYQNSRYICDNIGDVLGGHCREHAAYDVINERLGHKFSVEYWLMHEGYISADFENAARFGYHNGFETTQMHKYRLRWLKSLIAEFSAEEKQA
jgi:hypothetical protein